MPNGKKMIKLTMGEYVWETYAEAESRVSSLAAGLRSLLGPSTLNRNEKTDCPTPLVLFSETRAEWIYAAEASWRINRPIATLYATLGDDAVIHGLEQTEVSHSISFSLSISSFSVVFSTPFCFRLNT